jgi:hypothetical protein
MRSPVCQPQRGMPAGSAGIVGQGGRARPVRTAHTERRPHAVTGLTARSSDVSVERGAVRPRQDADMRRSREIGA